jgi:hypothetical protein
VGSFDEESQRSKYRATVPLNRKKLREFEHNSKEISVEWLFTCFETGDNARLKFKDSDLLMA